MLLHKKDNKIRAREYLGRRKKFSEVKKFGFKKDKSSKNLCGAVLGVVLILSLFSMPNVVYGENINSESINMGNIIRTENKSEIGTQPNIVRIDGLVIESSELKMYIPGSEGKIEVIEVAFSDDDKSWGSWSVYGSAKITYEGNDVYSVSWTNPTFINFVNDEKNVGKFLRFRASYDNKAFGAVLFKEIEDKKLSLEKEQAKKEIDIKAAEVKAEIDADRTLTADEKEKQKVAVNREAEQAKNAIDVAKDINGVNKAKDDGIKAIEAQHKSSVIEGELEIRYVDTAGKELAKRTQLTGEAGQAYQTEAKKIAGYVVKELPSNAAGSYGEGKTIITYVYEKETDKAPVVEGELEIRYVDANGKELAKRTQLTGESGQAYQTEAKLSLETYKTISSLPKTGTKVSYLLFVMGLTFISSVLGYFVWKRKK